MNSLTTNCRSFPRSYCRYMKILIVGENGLGRTTFVRNLFSSCEYGWC